MIVLKANAGKVTAGSVIPLTVEFNSNPTFYFNNNSIYIRSAGFVENIGGINVTATAVGNYGINIVADGNIVATYYADASAADDTITIPLYKMLRVIPTSVLNSYVNITFTAVNDLTIAGGETSLKYID